MLHNGLIPPDPSDQNAVGWVPTGSPPSRAGNRVTPYWNVMDYYVALGTTIRSHRTNQSDFVYIAGWELDLDTLVDPPSAGTRETLRSLLVQASKDGVSIRVLLDDTQNKGGNTAVATFIGNLKGGGGIVDPYHQLTGSHHQKMVVARVGEGVVAYCGGCDIANHRLARDGYSGPPVTSGELAFAQWHDVQVKVEGGSAADLWYSFVQRFKEVSNSGLPTSLPFYPMVFHVPVYGEKSLYEPTDQDFKRAAGDLVVQVVRTYPNQSVNHFDIPSTVATPMGYAFARNGETRIYDIIVNAINRTTSTIYLEDQYLVDSAPLARHTPARVTDALKQTIAKDSFKKMVIIVHGTPSVQGELYQAGSRRRDFFDQLGPDAAKKVSVYWYNYDLNSPFWFHSKTWVFDDKFAVVSSANCNRRSYSNDSEIGVGIADPNPGQNRLNFAHSLRMQLWLKHLNARPKSGPATPALKESDVLDFIAAAPKWDSAPLVAKQDLASDKTPDIPLSDRFFSSWRGSIIVGILLEKVVKRALGNRDTQWKFIDPDGT